MLRNAAERGYASLIKASDSIKVNMEGETGRRLVKRKIRSQNLVEISGAPPPFRFH